MPIKETYDELRPIAKTYSEQRFNAIVTFGGTATLIAKELTKDIPCYIRWRIGPCAVGNCEIGSTSRDKYDGAKQSA